MPQSCRRDENTKSDMYQRCCARRRPSRKHINNVPADDLIRIDAPDPRVLVDLHWLLISFQLISFRFEMIPTRITQTIPRISYRYRIAFRTEFGKSFPLDLH